jgi:hypothetical protein
VLVALEKQIVAARALDKEESCCCQIDQECAPARTHHTAANCASTHHGSAGVAVAMAIAAVADMFDSSRPLLASCVEDLLQGYHRGAALVILLRLGCGAQRSLFLRDDQSHLRVCA